MANRPVYKNKLHRAIKVAEVTITTVTATCERCKKSTSGQCTYPNHEIFVQRELKYITIHTNRSTRSMYPVVKLVCLECAKELEDFFMTPPDSNKEGESDADELGRVAESPA